MSSTFEEAFRLFKSSDLYLKCKTNCLQKSNIDFGSTEVEENIILIESKYFILTYLKSSTVDSNELTSFFNSILIVLDNKKDSNSETLQTKRSKQELDIFTIFAHEFRTPLTVIQSSVELLLEFFDQWDKEKINIFLKSIQEQTTSIGTLLEKIAELYDARTYTQEVVTVNNSTFEEFLKQIESILLKRFDFKIKNSATFIGESYLKVPMRAILYVLSIFLDSLQVIDTKTEMGIFTLQESNTIVIQLSNASFHFKEEEVRLLNTLFSSKIIEDVSGKSLNFLLVTFCIEYINSTVKVANSPNDGGTISIFLSVNLNQSN